MERKGSKLGVNRSFASRIKDTEMRHIAKLEKRLRTLKEIESKLSAELATLQIETFELTIRNNELRMICEAEEKEQRMRDVLNDALEEEIKLLKRLTGEYLKEKQAGFFLSPPSESENED